MARGLNKVMLIGHLGADPEVRVLPSGAPVANFSIATNEYYKDQNGELKERTEWHNIVAYGKLAEVCRQYLKKGKQVYIEGRLQTRNWEDKETGKKNYRTEIICAEMQMLGTRSDGGAEMPPVDTSDVPPAEITAPMPQPSAKETAKAAGEAQKDDLPF